MKRTLAVAALATVAFAGAAEARDQIRIVGLSTVFPFASKVVEQFGKTTSFKTPVIESTGSGGGLKLFCAGVGVDHPDITNASRAIKASEIETCTKNGVTEITIDFDGIVVADAKNGPSFSVSRKDLYLALAKSVPDPKGGDKLVANPYKTWKDVNPSLPANAIEVLGPPPTSSTRDAFTELVMDVGCESYPFVKAMAKTDKKAFTRVLKKSERLRRRGLIHRCYGCRCGQPIGQQCRGRPILSRKQYRRRCGLPTRIRRRRHHPGSRNARRAIP